MDVIEQRPEAVSWLGQNRFVAASKEMPPKAVPRVDAAREGVLQPSHSPGKVRLRSFQQKMVAVGHQHEGVNPKTAPLARFGQRAHEGLPVRVVPHYGLPAIATRHHMIKRSLKFHPHRSRHPPFCDGFHNNGNHKWLTPFFPPLRAFAAAQHDSVVVALIRSVHPVNPVILSQNYFSDRMDMIYRMMSCRDVFGR